MKRFIPLLSILTLFLLILPGGRINAAESIQVTSLTVKYENDQLKEVSVKAKLESQTNKKPSKWKVKIDGANEQDIHGSKDATEISPTFTNTDFTGTGEHSLEFTAVIEGGEAPSKKIVIPTLNIDYQKADQKHRFTGTFQPIKITSGNWELTVKSSSQQGNTTSGTETNANQASSDPQGLDNTAGTENNPSANNTNDPNNNTNLNSGETNGDHNNNQNNNTLNNTTTPPSPKTDAVSSGSNSFTADFAENEIASGTYDIEAKVTGTTDESMQIELSNKKNMQITGSTTTTTTDSPKTGDGAKLPNTATSYPNGVIIGVLLLALGLLFIKFRRA
ncbi:LPXTG cell wall anchor domain-containing protein [Thermoflavimicrobium daqui]|uniref:LPXTG cell wall anchor domain-containing protein n=1 Tax=Thermoflavimicrobium daqui TaxID=2137476 RepID=UPI00143D4B22|nr:LPXTG cell wall anchor domain-containing protein [Thermoflavimicrobium daqui]